LFLAFSLIGLLLVDIATFQLASVAGSFIGQIIEEEPARKP
jgi:hypothetical protein